MACQFDAPQITDRQVIAPKVVDRQFDRQAAAVLLIGWIVALVATWS